MGWKNLLVAGVVFPFAAFSQPLVPYRCLQESATGIDLVDSGKTDLVCRGAHCFFSTRSPSPRSLSVPMAQVTAAEQYVRRRSVSLKVEGGGRLKAIAESLVLLEVNGQVSVGIQVLYEDFIPEEGLNRTFRVLKEVVPLERVEGESPVDPLSVPIAAQKYFLGSTDSSGLVVPVYVLGQKWFPERGTFYFVLQARDLLEKKALNGTLYLVPSSRLREALSDVEYELALKDALSGGSSRDRVRFHQQVLMPWTHRVFDFKSAADPDFPWEKDLFTRRATQALVLLAAEPDSTEGLTINTSACADFLYDQAKD